MIGIVVALALVAAGCGSRRPPTSPEELQGALAGARQGGYVFYLRYAATEPEVEDANEVVLVDCTTQRNLSRIGRQQTERLRRGFERQRIPVGEVRSSPYCRCIETARIGFGRVESDPRLATVSRSRDEGAQVEHLRRLLAAPPAAGTSTVIVGHADNFAKVTGWKLEEGEVAIVVPDRRGGFDLAGSFTAHELEAISAGMASPEPMRIEISPPVRGAVDAIDRDDADRDLDAGRHPAQTLAFFGIAPGQRVAELFAGTGYTTELLARAVGISGRVYAQNNQFVLERFARGPWQERLRKPVMRNVIPVDRELDDPLPPQAQNVDAVVFVLAYHDAVWMGADRMAMNRAVWRALRPGGVYGIIDHSAAANSGLRDVETLHRIDQQQLVAEVLAAGFVLDAEADFLRNPADTRDWNASPRAAGDRRGSSDRFVLRFVKPAGG